MKLQFYLFLLCCLFFSAVSMAQKVLPPPPPDCCNNATCSAKAKELAVKITGILQSFGTCPEGNKQAFRDTLKKLKAENNVLLEDFWNTATAIVHLINDPGFCSTTLCFGNSLPQDLEEIDKIWCWIDLVNDSLSRVEFPPTEFCGGWKKRLEIAQGVSNFLSKKDMAYFASIRGYLIYTPFRGKEYTTCESIRRRDSCGGIVRFMAGPAYYLRNRTSYLALSSRIAFRIPGWDIMLDSKKGLFPVGNINLFGEYNTNFHQFNYAGLGVEVELGPFGINFTGNYNLENGRPGFLIGLILANKKTSNN